MLIEVKMQQKLSELFKNQVYCNLKQFEVFLIRLFSEKIETYSVLYKPDTQLLFSLRAILRRR